MGYGTTIKLNDKLGWMPGVRKYTGDKVEKICVSKKTNICIIKGIYSNISWDSYEQEEYGKNYRIDRTKANEFDDKYSYKNFIEIINLKNGKRINWIVSDLISGIDLSSNGKYYVTLSSGTSPVLKFFNSRTCDKYKEIPLPKEYIQDNSSTYSTPAILSWILNDSKICFYSDHYKKKSHDIVIWNVNTNEESMKLKGHTKEILGAITNESRDRLISFSRDKTIKVWNLNSGTIELDIQTPFEYIDEIILSDDSKSIVVIDGSIVNVYNMKTGKRIL